MALNLLIPVRCAGCGVAEEPWCRDCAAGARIPFAVSRQAIGHGPPAYALGRYRGAARRAVLACKERGRRDVAVAIGRAMAAGLPGLPHSPAGPGAPWYLVPAPSRPAAARRRGGQHMLDVARHCAAALAETGRAAAVAPALRLDRRARDSVGLDAEGRAANLRGRLRFLPAGAPPVGTPVVLLDDVITTGATAAACTSVLARAGIPVAAVLAFTATGDDFGTPAGPNPLPHLGNRIGRG
jgi:predicted amidophosphoribosyltransferase